MVQAALSGLRVNADADRKINSCLIENWVETAGARQIYNGTSNCANRQPPTSRTIVMV